MIYNLHNRNFLKLLDFTPEEIKFLLDLSFDLKKAKHSGTKHQRLKARILLWSSKRPLPEQDVLWSCSAWSGWHMLLISDKWFSDCQKESMKDTARVLGRMYDGIEYRGYGRILLRNSENMQVFQYGMDLPMSFTRPRFWLIYDDAEHSDKTS